MVKKIISLVFALLVAGVFFGTAGAAWSSEITVSAAIGLKNTFEEIGKLFESSNQGVKVLLNFGASGDLMTQIKAGAPVDVFASAGVKEIDELGKGAFILPDTRADFAGNSVVLIVPSASKLSLSSFEDLTRPEIQKVSIGNPETVPAGRYAAEVLHHYSIFEKLKDKFIFAENVRQVLDYVVRNEVDAGVVYSTDAMAQSKNVKVVASAPETSHQPIIYPVAVVKGSKNEQTARMFVSFVLSEAGGKILEKNGFKPVQK